MFETIPVSKKSNPVLNSVIKQWPNSHLRYKTGIFIYQKLIYKIE